MQDNLLAWHFKRKIFISYGGLGLKQRGLFTKHSVMRSDPKGFSGFQVWMVLRFAYCFVIRAGSIQSFSSAHKRDMSFCSYSIFYFPGWLWCFPSCCSYSFGWYSNLNWEIGTALLLSLLYGIYIRAAQTKKRAKSGSSYGILPLLGVDFIFLPFNFKTSFLFELREQIGSESYWPHRSSFLNPYT